MLMSMSSTSPSTIVLETPELVALIGGILPLWARGRCYLLRVCPEWMFCPETLLRLCRVSKTWYHAFVPIVWRVYDFDYMEKVPGYVLQKNTVHVRFIYAVYETLRFSIEEASFPQLKHVSTDDDDRPFL